MDQIELPEELWLVRHAESLAQHFHNLQQPYPGLDENPGLSELGLRQAAVLGHSWRGLPPPDMAFASPLFRPQETGRIAFENAGWQVPIRVVNNGFEQSFGVLANLLSSEIEQIRPGELLRQKQLGFWKYAAPGGESWEDVEKRAQLVWAIIRSVAADKRAIFFGHQVFNELLRTAIEGRSIHDTVTTELSRSHNCAVTSYKRVGDRMVLTGAYLRPRALIELTPGH
jgi:broad specificity phosphatase PhoE